MRPFQFPLQAVHTVRLHEENRALEAFALAQANFQNAAARHRGIQQEIDDVFGTRRQVMKKSARSDQVQQLQQGLRALQSALKKAEDAMQKARNVMDEKSRVLMAARQKREIVDKLFQKQHAAYQAEVARGEQKTMDELATMKSMGGLAKNWR